MRLSSAGPSAVIHKRRCCKGVCSSNMYSTLNDNQATLYDRQIRLWGIKTQERLSEARVLIVGCTGINCEAAKNLVLAGVDLTLVPGRSKPEPSKEQAHALQNCLLPNTLKSTLSLNDDQMAKHIVDRLKELNPFASVSIMLRAEFDRCLTYITQSDATVPSDETLNRFTVLVLDSEAVSVDTLFQLDTFCRQFGKGLFVSYGFGIDGAILQDFGPLFRVEPSKKSQEASLAMAPTVATFPSLSALLAIPYSRLPSGYSARRRPLPHEKLVAFMAFIQMKMSGCVDSELYERAIKEAGYTTGPSSLASQFWEGLLRSYNVPFTPSSSILGGLLTQEVQLFIAKVSSELHNVILFDGTTSEGLVFDVGITRPEQCLGDAS